MMVDISDLEMEERTIGVPRRSDSTALNDEKLPAVEAQIFSDIKDLEVQERTIGIPQKSVQATNKEEVKLEVDSDITNLELEERSTIGEGVK
jgi:hypothetical protein